MSIYNKGGTLLDSAYAVDGSELSAAYDIGGVQVFPEGVHLRVCTYNVGQWYLGTNVNVPADLDAAYYALQNGMIAAIDADILCLEEYRDEFSKTGRTAASMLGQYYEYIETYHGDVIDYYGRAICSKYPILSYTPHNYTGETRYYDEAVIDIDGTQVNVFVTHLHPSDQATKISEATQLCDYIKAQALQRYIVCGDFNSNLFYPFTETNAAIYNQFLNEGCTIANDGAFGILNTACNSENWDADAFAIDNIIASDSFVFTSVATDLTKTTDSIVAKIDHVPLYANMVMQAEEA